MRQRNRTNFPVTKYLNAKDKSWLAELLDAKRGLKILDYITHAILCFAYNDNVVDVNNYRGVLAATDARIQTRVASARIKSWLQRIGREFYSTDAQLVSPLVGS